YTYTAAFGAASARRRRAKTSWSLRRSGSICPNVDLNGLRMDAHCLTPSCFTRRRTGSRGRQVVEQRLELRGGLMRAFPRLPVDPRDQVFERVGQRAMDANGQAARVTKTRASSS